MILHFFVYHISPTLTPHYISIYYTNKQKVDYVSIYYTTNKKLSSICIKQKCKTDPLTFIVFHFSSLTFSFVNSVL